MGIADETRRLSIKWFALDEAHSILIASVIFAFSIWYVMMGYNMCMGHFLAIYAVLLGHRIWSSSHRLASVGLVLIALSFQLASNLLFVIASEMTQQLLHPRTTATVKQRLIRLGILLVLAAFWYVAVWKLHAPREMFVQYNQVKNPLQLESWMAFARSLGIFATWWALLLVPLAGLTYGLRGRFKLWLSESSSQKQLLSLAVLYAAAIAAYEAAGLGGPLWAWLPEPGARGVSAWLASTNALGAFAVWYGSWHSRHMLLGMVVFALIAAWVASVSSLLQAPASASRPSNQRFGLWAPSASMLVAFLVWLSCWGLPGFASKLKRLHTEASVVNALKQLQPPAPGLVALKIKTPIDFRAAPIESNLLLWQAYGKQDWVSYLSPNIAPVVTVAEHQAVSTVNIPIQYRENASYFYLMKDFRWNVTCRTSIEFDVSNPGLSDWVYKSSWNSNAITLAKIISVTQNC